MDVCECANVIAAALVGVNCWTEAVSLFICLCCANERVTEREARANISML